MSLNSPATSVDEQHTRGPWLVFGYEVVDQANELIAKTSTPRRTHPEERANARLIAAAPELYEALRGLMAAEHPPYRGPLQYDSLREDAWDAARAAVAKAEGRQP